MIRKAIIAVVILGTIVLLIDGRVPKKGCDFFLRAEWGRANVLRQTDEHIQLRPTKDEAARLRSTIRICRYFTSQFDLTDTMHGTTEVWGNATLINPAVELDDVSLLDQLVAEGHSFDGLPNSLGITTLYFATYRQMSNAFYWALDKGVDPNLADTDGVTPLMHASMSPQNYLESIRSLLDVGAYIDALDSSGRSPLVFAIRRTQYKNAYQLASAGADISLARQAMVRELENAISEIGVARIHEAIDFLDANLAQDLAN